MKREQNLCLLISRSFRAVLPCAAAIGVLCAGGGILVSILAGTPVGSTIVAADIAAFLVLSVVGTLRK